MAKKKPALGKMSSARTRKAKLKKAAVKKGKNIMEVWMSDKGGL